MQNGREGKFRTVDGLYRAKISASPNLYGINNKQNIISQSAA